MGTTPTDPVVSAAVPTRLVAAPDPIAAAALLTTDLCEVMGPVRLPGRKRAY